MLGDRLIHLQYYLDVDLSFEANGELHDGLHWSPELEQPYGSAWRQVVCEEDCPENQEDQKKQMYHGGILSVRSHQICHSDLQYDSMGPDGMYKEDYCFGREMVRLGVLRSCRQIYVEANNILWTTNTFSFADATTLKRFMMTRTINQKHSIKSIRLQMAFEIYEWEKEWNTALSMPLVRSLSGLRCLRLSIEYEMKAKNYNSAKPTTSFLTPPIVKVYTRSRPCH